jgi:GAF domain-containing protein
MNRRSKSAGEPIKGPRRKAREPKRRNAPKVEVHSKSAPVAEEKEVARLARERDEALEQQTATSEVLRVISASPGELEPVFQAMLERAVRVCGATFGNIYRWDGEALHILASHNTPPAFVEAVRRSPYRPYPHSPIGRMLANRTVAHINDVTAEEVFLAQRDPMAVTAVELGGIRTLLGVPLLNKGEMIGAFFLSRQEVRPFTEKQIDLVKNFAAQAVIAIENARLLNELRQRTTDLTERTADLMEALEQQTATSEVLQVISSSPGDLKPVFQAILENATRICQAKFGVVFSFDGNEYRVEAQVGTPPELVEYMNRTKPVQILPGSLLDRVKRTKRVSYTADYAAEGIPAPPVTLGGARSTVDVPMLKDGELVGAFSIYRQEVRPFTERQIALLTNFAAQAVIAIENARLLNELRQRTTDLTDALEQQTASAEVLQAISSSAGDLEPVFATMLRKAVSICDAKFGTLYFREGDRLRLIATHGVPPAFAETQGKAPFRPASDGMLDTVMRTGRTVHLADLAHARSYIERDPRMVEAVEIGGIRSVVGVPLIKDDELIGLIGIYRQEVRPFGAKQIEVLTNFADQAVIAIENARLLNELRQRTTDLTEALEQQTATSEVLQVVGSSPGDLEPVFATMLEKAVRICEATFGNIYRWNGECLSLVAAHNTPPAFLEAGKHTELHFDRNDPVARVIKHKKLVHVPDMTQESEYLERDNERLVAGVELAGIRTFLVVPMLKEDELIGTFHLSRQEVRPFDEKQIELVQNFAAQAVIAIENTRLLKELRDRTEEVEKLNQHLEQRVADQVGEIERMGRLRRFLPPQVADLIVASGTEKQLESHRREITALFCDLRGFTGFTESADAEDVMALLRDYHAAIGEIIIKYNGTLERYAGDGVMVVFNDPVPVENPALQAVLMALEVRVAIGALTETWRRWGHDIGFGIGIAHGFATLGTIGFEGRFDYAAIGTVSNVASRLCDEAKPGQILISPRVLTKVENAVKVEPVGEFELKGIRRPLAAYNVLGVAS